MEQVSPELEQQVRRYIVADGTWRRRHASYDKQCIKDPMLVHTVSMTQHMGGIGSGTIAINDDLVLSYTLEGAVIDKVQEVTLLTVPELSGIPTSRNPFPLLSNHRRTSVEQLLLTIFTKLADRVEKVLAEDEQDRLSLTKDRLELYLEYLDSPEVRDGC